MIKEPPDIPLPPRPLRPVVNTPPVLPPPRVPPRVTERYVFKMPYAIPNKTNCVLIRKDRHVFCHRSIVKYI